MPPRDPRALLADIAEACANRTLGEMSQAVSDIHGSHNGGPEL